MALLLEQVAILAVAVVVAVVVVVVLAGQLKLNKLQEAEGRKIWPTSEFAQTISLAFSKRIWARSVCLLAGANTWRFQPTQLVSAPPAEAAQAGQGRQASL